MGHWAVLSCGAVYYFVQGAFESVDEILKCDIEMKATELYFPVVPFIVLYWQGGYNFGVFGWNLQVQPLKWNLLRLSSTFLSECLLSCTRNFWVCGWNPKVLPLFKWTNKQSATMVAIILVVFFPYENMYGMIPHQRHRSKCSYFPCKCVLNCLPTCMCIIHTPSLACPSPALWIPYLANLHLGVHD